MSKLCERDAHLTAENIVGIARLHSINVMDTHHLRKMLSFDNSLTRKNNTGRLNHCGATLIASSSSTSKLAFRIHSFDQKIAIQIQSPRIFKELIIGYSRLKVFAVIFSYKTNKPFSNFFNFVIFQYIFNFFR